MGADPAAPLPGSGTGLIGLVERVGLAGGSLEHGWTPEGEFRLRAQAVTQAIVDGTLNFRISGSYPLAEAGQAHRDLQGRRTTGSIVLRVAD